MDITRYFEPERIWPDTNGDGYPDDLSLTLAVDPAVTDAGMWAGILNLTARLTMETTAFSLPVVYSRGKRRSPLALVILPPGRYPKKCRGKGQGARIWQPDSHTAYLVGESALEMGRHLNRLAFGLAEAGAMARRLEAPLRVDLLNLAGDAGVYKTDGTNPRSRVLKAGILLESPSLSHALGLSLCDVTARMALGATSATLPVASCGSLLDKEILFNITEGHGIPDSVELNPPAESAVRLIRMAGDPRTLPGAVRKWAAWTFADGGQGCRHIDGFREKVAAFQQRISGRLPAEIPPAAPEGKCISHLTWIGEVDAMIDLAAGVPGGRGEAEGLIFVSKPLEIRQKLKEEMETLLRSRGYDPCLRVLNAYKPGLCWLREEVLPALKGRKDVDRILISYRPFTGMEGSIELRSRWLQEMFPAGELAAAELGIEAGQIGFSENADQPDIYRIQAHTASGKRLLDVTLSPRIAQMPFLAGRPELGCVHPTTGGIRLRQGERLILDKAVATDRERFWERFQTEWLPVLLDRVTGDGGRSAGKETPAFWEDIRMDVWIDETDIPLGIDEERISPMEALHEDLYFVLLAAFADLSERCGLSDAVQLGRITPRTHARTRGKTPSARLLATPLGGCPAAASPLSPAPAAAAAVMRLLFSHGAIGVELARSTEKIDEKVLAASGAHVVEGFSDRIGLTLSPPMPEPSAFPFSGRQMAPEPEGPPDNRLLMKWEVHAWLKRLDGMPHLSVWRAAESCRQQPVWAVEAVLQGGGKCLSIPKLRLLKPTVFCNARHHANEVSSTQACLQTAWMLAATPGGRSILKDVNLVFVPMENPDGVATLESLLPLGPGRKNHAARYNALGAEYYSDYFRSPPRFPEAAAKPRLWKRWLPDVMIDHHGVPCHEWDQPFSGYAPRRFQEYWIPRTFVYILIPFVESAGHPLQEPARRLVQMAQDVLGAQPDIVSANRRIAARYDLYARGPEPDVFPPTSDAPLLVYPLSERSRTTNFAVRFPEITCTDMIVEVPDEVASGDMLARCVRAHRNIQEAAILFLQRPKGSVYKESDPHTGQLRILWQSSPSTGN